ncbi:MAG: retropepsin-like aspartic protease [Pseudomonadota bacterium]
MYLKTFFFSFCLSLTACQLTPAKDQQVVKLVLDIEYLNFMDQQAQLSQPLQTRHSAQQHMIKAITAYMTNQPEASTLWHNFWQVCDLNGIDVYEPYLFSIWLRRQTKDIHPILPAEACLRSQGHDDLADELKEFEARNQALFSKAKFRGLQKSLSKALLWDGLKVLDMGITFFRPLFNIEIAGQTVVATFDTGSEMTLFGNQLIEKWKLKKNGEHNSVSSHIGNRISNSYRAPTIHIGDITIDNLTVGTTITPYNNIVVLGMDVLRQFDNLLVTQQDITFNSRQSIASDKLQPMYLQQNTLFTQMTINNHLIWLHIDTGSDAPLTTFIESTPFLRTGDETFTKIPVAQSQGKTQISQVVKPITLGFLNDQSLDALNTIVIQGSYPHAIKGVVGTLGAPIIHTIGGAYFDFKNMQIGFFNIEDKQTHE